MTGRTGVIHDIGYQRYQGVRHGRAAIGRALFWHSLRTAFGFGRGAKAKIFPWLVSGVVLITAVVFTALHTTAGVRPVSFTEFPDRLIVLVILFAAVAAPELVSRDLRSGVLPLYFARPLRPDDYAWAKVAALVSAVWLLLAGPLTVMVAGAALAADDLGVVADELVDGLAGYAYAALVAAVIGALALLVASLMSRRAVAAGAVVALFLVTLPVVELLESGVVVEGTPAALAGIGNPATMVSGVRQWLAGDQALAGYGGWYAAATAVFLVACVVLVTVRYRKVAR